MNTPDYTVNDPKGWCGDPRRGAAMGRSEIAGDPKFSGRLYLRRVHIDSEGYDRNGTYFGIGDPLYWFANEDSSIDGVLRATSRTDARRLVLDKYPHATVKR